MGTITRRDLKSGGICFNCNELANAEHVGKRLAIGICKNCAIEILPRLIAHAVTEFALDTAPEDAEASFRNYWDEAHEHFSEIVELVLATEVDKQNFPGK